MTPENLAALTREAEEKYPLHSDEVINDVKHDMRKWYHLRSENGMNLSFQKAHISAATPYIEKMEAIRAEVEKIKSECYQPRESRYYEGKAVGLSQVLSIIDKHLKP